MINIFAFLKHFFKKLSKNLFFIKYLFFKKIKLKFLENLVQRIDYIKKHHFKLKFFFFLINEFI